MKGVYHHSLKRRWYARHPTTKKYKYSVSVDTTMKWGTGETIDFEAEDDSDAGSPEFNQDNQEVADVDSWQLSQNECIVSCWEAMRNVHVVVSVPWVQNRARCYREIAVCNV